MRSPKVRTSSKDAIIQKFTKNLQNKKIGRIKILEVLFTSVPHINIPTSSRNVPSRRVSRAQRRDALRVALSWQGLARGRLSPISPTRRQGGQRRGCPPGPPQRVVAGGALQALQADEPGAQNYFLARARRRSAKVAATAALRAARLQHRQHRQPRSCESSRAEPGRRGAQCSQPAQPHYSQPGPAPS